MTTTDALNLTEAAIGHRPDPTRAALPGSLAANPRLDRWLAFDAAGHVTVTPGKVELGQGILTALAFSVMIR